MKFSSFCEGGAKMAVKNVMYFMDGPCFVAQFQGRPIRTPTCAMGRTWQASGMSVFCAHTEQNRHLSAARHFTTRLLSPPDGGGGRGRHECAKTGFARPGSHVGYAFSRTRLCLRAKRMQRTTSTASVYTLTVSRVAFPRVPPIRGASHIALNLTYVHAL